MTAIRKHRAPDRVRQLEAANADLRKQLAAHQSAGDRLAESILRGIQDATALEEARRRLAVLEDEVGRLRAERVDVSVVRKQLATAEAHIRRISETNVALRAQVQNANRVDVPPMHRDIDPGEQATTPTDVTTLRRSFPVMPLAEAFGGAL